MPIAEADSLETSPVLHTEENPVAVKDRSINSLPTATLEAPSDQQVLTSQEYFEKDVEENPESVTTSRK